MYNPVLALHSWWRWLVLISLVYAIYRSFSRLRLHKTYTPFDNSVRHITATIAHVQLLLGLWLYFISPVIQYFLSNYKSAVHDRSIRFFGMEHSVMMFVAIVLITTGSASAKRKPDDHQKFKTVAIWFSIALFIILLSIPWPFSPLVSRGYFRM